MFIVQRKLNQSVVINDETKISIVKIGENSVKLCIDAPKGVKITRVVDESAGENKEDVENGENSKGKEGLRYWKNRGGKKEKIYLILSPCWQNKFRK